MGQFAPESDDQVLLEPETLEGGIRVSAEKLDAFAERIDNDLVNLVRRWQHLAAPRAALTNRRIHWR